MVDNETQTVSGHQENWIALMEDHDEFRDLTLVLSPENEKSPASGHQEKRITGNNQLSDSDVDIALNRRRRSSELAPTEPIAAAPVVPPPQRLHQMIFVPYVVRGSDRADLEDTDTDNPDISISSNRGDGDANYTISRALRGRDRDIVTFENHQFHRDVTRKAFDGHSRRYLRCHMHIKENCKVRAIIYTDRDHLIQTGTHNHKVQRQTKVDTREFVNACKTQSSTTKHALVSELYHELARKYPDAAKARPLQTLIRTMQVRHL